MERPLYSSSLALNLRVSARSGRKTRMTGGRYNSNLSSMSCASLRSFCTFFLR